MFLEGVALKFCPPLKKLALKFLPPPVSSAPLVAINNERSLRPLVFALAIPQESVQNHPKLFKVTLTVVQSHPGLRLYLEMLYYLPGGGH